MTQVTILTAGSRGDVQPYLGLGRGLQAASYNVRIVATDDFETLVRGAGLDFVSSGENVASVVQSEEWRERIEGGNFIAIQAGMRKELESRAPDMARRTIKACEGADIILGGMGFLAGGYSIAEKLGVPAVEAHLFPTTPTRHISSPILPDLPFGSLLNPAAMRLTRQILWHSLRVSDVATREQLKLSKGSFWGPFSKRKYAKSPTIYGYSQHVCPKPPDWDDHHHVVGYWFLDTEASWQPPQPLVDFLEAGEPPVYIGFGSMLNKDVDEVAQIVIAALSRTGQRGVLASGWGGLSQIDRPDSVYMLPSIPHSWLFPKMKAVVHHGGAGTTAAGLRAGIPTIIVPFFGDQPFWGRRIHELGVGSAPIPRKQLTSDTLANAIQQVTSDVSIQQRAAGLGQEIQAEDSITPVVNLIKRLTKNQVTPLTVNSP